MWPPKWPGHEADDSPPRMGLVDGIRPGVEGGLGAPLSTEVNAGRRIPKGGVGPVHG